jgi:hypothetical protein
MDALDTGHQRRHQSPSSEIEKGACLLDCSFSCQVLSASNDVGVTVAQSVRYAWCAGAMEQLLRDRSFQGELILTTADADHLEALLNLLLDFQVPHDRSCHWVSATPTTYQTANGK